jgi:hypothetical protein
MKFIVELDNVNLKEWQFRDEIRELAVKHQFFGRPIVSNVRALTRAEQFFLDALNLFKDEVSHYANSPDGQDPFLFEEVLRGQAAQREACRIMNQTRNDKADEKRAREAANEAG